MKNQPFDAHSALARQFLSVAMAAARNAGRLLLDRMGKDFPMEKAPGDFVTAADRLSQEAIAKELEIAFPDHQIWGEENTQPAGWQTGFCWIIDPLDGTMNYIHRLPNFSVSIGLVHKGVPLIGVVHDPCLNETFTAIRGGGAFRNGLPIHVSSCQQLRSSLLVCSFPPRVESDSPELRRFLRVVQLATLRRLGSAALNLCYVAMGRLDGYWASTLSVWDVAAGILIAAEAGAVVTALDGSPFCLAQPQLCAVATEALQAELLPRLQLNEGHVSTA